MYDISEDSDATESDGAWSVPMASNSARARAPRKTEEPLPVLHAIFAKQVSELQELLEKARSKPFRKVSDSTWAQVTMATRDGRDALATLAASLFRADVDLEKARVTLEQVRRCLRKGLSAEECCARASAAEECATAAKALVSCGDRIVELLTAEGASDADAKKLLHSVFDAKVARAWLQLAKRVSLGVGASVLVQAVAGKLKDLAGADSMHSVTHAAAADAHESERSKAVDVAREVRVALGMPGAAMQLEQVAVDAVEHGPSLLAEAASQAPEILKDLASKLDISESPSRAKP